MKSSEVVWLLLLTRPIGWKLSSLQESRSPSWPPLVTPSRTSAARTCSQHASRAHYTITSGYYHLDVLPVRRQSAPATNELAIALLRGEVEVENTPIFSRRASATRRARSRRSRVHCSAPSGCTWPMGTPQRSRKPLSNYPKGNAHRARAPAAMCRATTNRAAGGHRAEPGHRVVARAFRDARPPRGRATWWWRSMAGVVKNSRPTASLAFLDSFTLPTAPIHC